MLREAFKTLLKQMQLIMGPEQGSDKGWDYWWDMPSGGRIHLERLSRAVEMYIRSKRYADTERLEADLKARGRWEYDDDNDNE